MPKESQDLDRIIARIQGLERRPLLVAIDGQGGAGKSTLARALVERLGDDRATVVEGDDFYRDMAETDREQLTPEEGVEEFFDWQRLRRLMESVRAGQSELTYRPYDWVEGRLSDEPTAVPMPDVVIVEGVYSLREQLRDLVDLAVWVETSSEERLQRIRDRGENTDADIDRWEQAERAYVRSQDPAAVADVHIAGATQVAG